MEKMSFEPRVEERMSNIAFIHHEGRHTIKVEIHKKHMYVDSADEGNDELTCVRSDNSDKST